MASPRKKDKLTTSSQAGRVSIINAVQTPLGFFTLGLLILEGGLLGISALVPEQSRTALVWGCLILIFLTILVVALLAYTRPEYLFGAQNPKQLSLHSGELGDISMPAADSRSFKYDVFLSSPMAALAPGKEYEANRRFVLKLIEALRKECGFDSIFYAGRHIESTVGFDPADISVKDDLEAIHNSRYFIMIYPAKVVTSVLVEAGWAVALRRPSIYFVNDEEHLPFLLKEAVQAFKHVKLYKFQQLDEIATMICKYRLKLFEERT